MMWQTAVEFAYNPPDKDEAGGTRQASPKLRDASRKQGQNSMTLTTEPPGHKNTAQDAGNWKDELSAIAQHRDRKAFERLFSHFAPKIKAFGMKALNTQALAEELMQETMLLVWTKAEKFDPRIASASTWIFTIARNKRIDILRKLSQRDSEIHADDLWPDFDHEDEDLMDLPEQANLEEASQKLQAHMEKLSAPQLQVIQKVFLEEKSHSVVAQELNLPLGTVKSRVRLAMEKLKQYMQ